MKINVSKKNGKTIFRIGRRIECYVNNSNFVHFGSPSSKCIDIVVCNSVEDAESYAIEWCKKVILERMKYENPTKYNALRIINAVLA